MSLHLWDYAPDALEVTVSELLIATAATSDSLIDDSVRELLHGLRENLGMDVIFFSEIRDGQRQFKHVDNKPGCEVIATGGGSTLEESFCQCVLDGRLPQLVHDAASHPAFKQLPATPFRVGAHLSVPIVLADENMMRQLWLNLLGNAMKYSAQRDPTLIDVGYRRLDDGRHEFTVRDNGVGFDATRLPQASHGLVGMRHRVEASGGRLDINSRAGGGSRITGTIPRAVRKPQSELAESVGAMSSDSYKAPPPQTTAHDAAI